MTPVQRGVDTSGRPRRQSPVFWSWWDEYVARLGFEPTITQAGWMGDLAADLSGPTHDGDALDLRVWDRTRTEVETMVRVARQMGAAAWLRDKHHGGFSDPHVHLVPGSWAHPSPAAVRQWQACRDGRDGLASNGPDYHPYPLASTWEADDMPYTEKQLRDIIRSEVDAAIERHDEAVTVKRWRVLRRALTNIIRGDRANTATILAELKKD